MKKRNGLQREFFRKNRLMFCVVIGVSALVAGLNLVLSVLLQQAIDLASGVSTTWTLPQLIVISILVLVGVLAAGIGTCLAKPRFLRRAMQEKHAFRSSCRDLCLRPLLCAIGSYCRMSGRNGSHVADWAAGSR